MKTKAKNQTQFPIIESFYTNYCNIKSDINEHLPVLYQYSLNCNHITEMGVRDVVSTWAFLKSMPNKLISYDIMKSNNINIAASAAKEAGIEFQFYQKDVLLVEIEETDLLFIDTLHSYNQLKQELNLHSSKVRKFIIMHDTSKFANVDERTGASGGLWPALEEFLDQTNEWQLKERYTNNNGLTIIERI